MAKGRWHNLQLWCHLLAKLEEPLGTDVLNRAALGIAVRMEDVVADHSDEGLLIGSAVIEDLAGGLATPLRTTPRILDGHVDPGILRRGAASALQMTVDELAARPSTRARWLHGEYSNSLSLEWSVNALAILAGHVPAEEARAVVPRVFRKALEVGSDIPAEASESLLLRLPLPRARSLASDLLDDLENSSDRWRGRSPQERLSATLLGAARRLGGGPRAPAATGPAYPPPRTAPLRRRRRLGGQWRYGRPPRPP